MKPSTSSYQDIFRKLTTLTLATAFAGQFLVMPCQASQTPTKPFKLRVDQGFIKPEEGPSLNRNDIKNAGDPFDSSGTGTEDAFEPPSGAFQVQTSKTGNPPPFRMQAEDTGGFNGQGMPGMGDQMPQEQAPRQAMMPPDMQPPTQMNQMRPNNPNDPDGQEMKLAWDEWHRRVAECIYNQISTAAKTMLPNTRPLVCVINYTVTRDGRVVNVHLQQNSPNILYNGMVYAVVSRMAGNPVLQFPQGSRRMSVDKISTFGHNNGGPQGFRSITGDQETMRQQNMRGR
jgi:YD repeat-containing protein